MRVFHYRNIEPKDAGKESSGVSVRWLITREMGAENFAMRLFEVRPGGYSPFHGHSWEHEIFVLTGEGTVVFRGGERKFKKGDVIFVSSNEEHQFKNSGRNTLKFLCSIPLHE